MRSKVRRFDDHWTLGCRGGTAWRSRVTSVATTSTACDNCINGKYQEQNTADSVTCKFCAAGKKFNSKSTVCTDCINGQYQNQNTLATAVCKTCGAGQYASAKENNCGPCESGKFQDFLAFLSFPPSLLRISLNCPFLKKRKIRFYPIIDPKPNLL